MKTKFFFTSMLLGISISAFCVTAKEMLINPYYPEHVYGGAKLDSVVYSSAYGDENHVQFDEKGRMISQQSYRLENNQLTLSALVEYGYGEGIMYTTGYQRYWDSQTQKWQELKAKIDDIIYDAAGNPLRMRMYQWNTDASRWDYVSSRYLEYDAKGNIVQTRDSSLYGSGDAYWHVSFGAYKYVYDDKGRVVEQYTGYKYSEEEEFEYEQKIEYTYNSHGERQAETTYYNSNGDESTDPKWTISSTIRYVYNAFNNLEKKSQYYSDNIENYRLSYYYSYPSSTTEVEDATVAATPSANYGVTLQWPAVNDANTYVLDIRKNGELVCSLTFNAQGQLIGISFAPAHDGNAHKAPAATQTTGGWQYKLEGLDENTEYSFTATAKKDDIVLFAQTVFFTTTLEALEDIQIDSNKSVKILHNGQILILRGDKTYTLQGQEVR